MSYKIILSVLLGMFVGHFVLPEFILQYTDIVIDIGLCFLLLIVGMDIGRNKKVLYQIKKMGFRILLIPVMIIIGSIVGSCIGGFFVKLPINEASAIGAILPGGAGGLPFPLSPFSAGGSSASQEKVVVML